MQAPVPFASAEAAWFWTVATIEARRNPGRPMPMPGPMLGPMPGPPPGPCRPEDVVKCLDELYRRRRVDLLHARILRLYGRRGRAPDPRRAMERCDWRLWTEALRRLEFPLRRRGIVAGPPPRD